MAFNWENLSKGLAKELARSAGLRVSCAAEDLMIKFGAPPTEAVVIDLWPTLRDRWLATRPIARDQVVFGLRKAGLGDGAIKLSSKTGQMAYLKSCRLSSTLREIVLASLNDEGSQPMMAPSIMVDSPQETLQSQISPDWSELQGRVVAMMTELMGGTPVFDGDGDIGVARGSSGIYLRILEKEVPIPMVRMVGTLVRDVQPTLELLGDINEANQGLLFIRLVFVDGMVLLDGHIPADHLTIGELSFFLNESLMAADHFDTLLSARHNGTMMGADRGEVVDA